MATRSEVTVGFVGCGAVEKRNVNALLRDWIDTKGGAVKAVLPLTRSYWNESLAVVAGFLVENDIPIEALVDDTTAKLREVKQYLGLARKQYQTTDPAHKMAAVLEEARDGALIILWDDEDDTVHATAREVNSRGGITLLDLTDGLDKIDLQVPDEDEGADEEEPTSDELEDEEAGDEEEDEEEFESEDEDETDEDDDESEEMTGDEDENGEDYGSDPDSEDDLEQEAEDEEYDELPDDDDEAVTRLPEEDEEEMLTELMEAEPATTDPALLGLLERLVVAAEKLVAHLAGASTAKAITPARQKAASAPQPPAKPKAAPAAKKAAPAPQKAAEKPPVKRTVAPAKKTTAKKVAPPVKKAPSKPAPAASTNGKMTKAQAQRIMDAYRPRRGRPPAEVTEARQVLGLI